MFCSFLIYWFIKPGEGAAARFPLCSQYRAKQSTVEFQIVEIRLQKIENGLKDFFKFPNVGWMQQRNEKGFLFLSSNFLPGVLESH
jgi:hypothetical protein